MNTQTRVGSISLSSPLLIGSGYITEDTPRSMLDRPLVAVLAWYQGPSNLQFQKNVNECLPLVTS